MYWYKLVIFCLCNFAIAAVIPQEKDAVIVSYVYKNYGNGEYVFSYVTSNGIARNETGQLLEASPDKKYIAVQGYYSYTDPKGYFRMFKYTADENGYHVDIMKPLGFREGEGDEEKFTGVSFAAVAPQIASLLGK